MKVAGISFASIGILFLYFPSHAFAHAFGQLYNLPVPFWLYLYASTGAIILSFLIIGFFVNKKQTKLSYPTRPAGVIFQFFIKRKSILLEKIGATFLFIFTILTGLFGVNDTYTNFSMTFFWVIFLLGFTYLTGILGNFWDTVNPVKFLTESITKLIDEPLFLYPKYLSYYPALVQYFFLIWIELFAHTTPFSLSLLLLQYLFITVCGVVLFGAAKWYTYGDFFSVFFRLVGKMGIFENRNRKLYLRLPFSRLIVDHADNISLVFFIIFMLSSTAYDGFRSTTIWAQVTSASIEPFVAQLFGDIAGLTVQAAGLFVSFGGFLLLFIFLIYLAKKIARSPLPLSTLLQQFAFTLIPIAFVYNAAHYFMLLVTESQNLYRILSDPFGFGWNIFGTKQYASLFLPSATVIWHSQVVLILLGHIIGVYLAHMKALEVFPTHKRALLSQLPLLIIMVIYTIIGLWILSQPITSG